MLHDISARKVGEKEDVFVSVCAIKQTTRTVSSSTEENDSGKDNKPEL